MITLIHNISIFLEFMQKIFCLKDPAACELLRQCTNCKHGWLNFVFVVFSTLHGCTSSVFLGVHLLSRTLTFSRRLLLCCVRPNACHWSVCVFSRLCVCLLLLSQSECGFSCSGLASNLNVNKLVILNWENQCVNVGEIWSRCSGHVEYISLLLWFRASFSTINLYLAQKTSWKFNKPVNFAKVQDPEVAFFSRALIFASQKQ